MGRPTTSDNQPLHSLASNAPSHEKPEIIPQAPALQQRRRASFDSVRRYLDCLPGERPHMDQDECSDYMTEDSKETTQVCIVRATAHLTPLEKLRMM